MITAKQAQKDHHNLKRCWSNETKLSQRVLIGVLRRLEQQGELLAKLVQQKRTKRPLTKYQRFFGQQAKGGLSAHEVAKLWQQKKNEKILLTK